MGALLVTLLQSRHNQALYPNVSGTQARQVTYQHPCSVPLVVAHDASSQQSDSPPEVNATPTSASIVHGDEKVQTTGNDAVADRPPHFHVSPGSSELGGSPGFYKQHPLALAALNKYSAGEKRGEDGAREGTAAVDEATRQHAKNFHEQQRHEQLRFGLTCQRHTSAASDNSATAVNAIYRYTLPGAPSPLPTPSAQPPLLPLTATATTKPATNVLPLSRLPSSATPPSHSDGQSTQPGGRAEQLLERTRRLQTQTSVSASATAGACDGDPPTPLSLTPLRPTLPRAAGQQGGGSGGGGTRSTCISSDEMYGVSALPVHKEDSSKNLYRESGEEEEEEYTGDGNERGSEGAATELGPMDCADAFQYFYDDEDAYRDVESVTYVAPSKALIASQEAAAAYYLNQRTAMCGVSASGASHGSRKNACEVVDRAVQPHAVLSSLSASLQGKSTPPPAPVGSSQAIHLTGANINIHRSLQSNNYNNNSSTSPSSAGLQQGRCASASADQPPHDAGRFVSLVEEMYAACRRVKDAPFVCWRTIDRIAPLQESSRRLFGGSSSTGGGSGASSALQNARGEVEDDVSHLPGAFESIQTESTSGYPLDAAHASAEHRNSNSSSGSNAGAPRAAASSLYYLGPQQYLTASVWWSRVEAFSFGLRSIGLRPGDFLGVVEDTRWEWMVTCYAAWNTGLVVVAFDASASTMRRVAMDTHGEMKAIVCNPLVRHALHRHFRQAALTAIRHGMESRAGDAPDPYKTNATGSSDSGRSGHDVGRTFDGDGAGLGDITGKRHGGGTTTASDAPSTTATQSHARQRERYSVPLFIIVRSAAPVVDGDEARVREAQKERGGVLFSTARTAGLWSSPSVKPLTAAAESGPRWPPRRASSSRRAGARTELGSSREATLTNQGGAPSMSHQPSRIGRSLGSDIGDDEDRGEADDEEEEEEEEEALWWTDILSHGEAKVIAWRQRQARERRQVQQQQQARLRFQQQQQQRQRWGREGLVVAGVHERWPVASFSSSSLSGAPSAMRRRPSSNANVATGGSGSREGSAMSASITDPTLAWATATSTMTTTTPMTSQSGNVDAAAAAAVADGGTRSGFTTRTPALSVNTAPVLVVRADGQTWMSPTPYARTPSPQRGAGAAATTMLSTAHTQHHNDSYHRHRVPSPNLDYSVTPQPPHGPASPQHPLAHSTGIGNPATTSTQPPLAPLRPDDLALVLYTEGEPKGVLLTHGALKASMAAHEEYLDATDTGFDDGLRRGSWGGGAGNSYSNNADSSSNGASAQHEKGSGNGDGGGGESRLARYYNHASMRMPALRSRTAPSGRPAYLAYLPLHLISEFMAQTTFLIRGVLVCYGTRRTLFDAFARPHGDLTEYKPTIFPALPATLARLHRAVQAMLSTGYRKLLFDVAYEARRQAIRRGLQSPFVLSTIFAQPRELLGGRCRMVFARDAPLHPRDQEYLEVVCGVSVVQQYGPVETAGCGLMQAYCGGRLDTMGGPLGPVQVKLRDVAGGWSHQSERPTGELLLRGPTVMAGYYRQPERTAEVLEKSGWVHTQMVAERCPDGAFRLVASLRPHFALTSNGHCVHLERLEAFYARHPLCAADGVCVLVHPYRRYICALILSSEARVRAFVQEEARRQAAVSESDLGASPASSPGSVATSLAALGAVSAEPGWWPRCLRDPSLHIAAARSLAAWAMEREGSGHAMAPHERVRRVRVLHDVWDSARHTRTATGRLFRHGLHCRYGAIIHELFAEPD